MRWYETAKKARGLESQQVWQVLKISPEDQKARSQAVLQPFAGSADASTASIDPRLGR